MKFPKISVITPSFNQGKFIEQTILSVIGQMYPNLEYIIIDGGSTDDSIEVIKKYEKHINYWKSEKDNGQAYAINSGFKICTGDILCWINSDDYFLPGTLGKVAELLNPEHPELLFGNCLHLYENNTSKTRGSNLENRLRYNHFMSGSVIQPSTFWTRKSWDLVGELESSLHYTFDVDWYNRAIKNNILFKYYPGFLSVYRIHDAHKTSGGGLKRLNEIAFLYGKHLNLEHRKAFENLYKSGFNLFIIKQVMKYLYKRNFGYKILAFLFRWKMNYIKLNDLQFMIQRVSQYINNK